MECFIEIMEGCWQWQIGRLNHHIHFTLGLCSHHRQFG